MADHYFGYSQLELDRLMAEAVVLRPITERLLLKAGLRPGMRVLDLGCGAGDVSLLVAERVGPGGVVVGVDVAERAVALARRRAEDAGYDNAVFHLATEPEVEIELFDFVIGRAIVAHQADPVGFIRAAAARLHPGGVIAFHEVDLRSGFATLPPVLHFDVAAAELMEAIRDGAPAPDAAGRLVSLFVEAGLPVPKLFCERPAGADLDSPIYRWVATSYAATRLQKHPEESPLAVDSLEVALRDAATALHSQIHGPDQCCAWVRL